MRAVALLLSGCLLGTSSLGCFPHDAHKRTLAQLGEGASILAGVGIEFLANTGADCDQMSMPGVPNSTCHTKSSIIGDAGLVLILGGLLGFLATISTAEEDKTPPPIDIKAAKPEDKPALTLPPGVKGGGSAAPAPAAP